MAHSVGNYHLRTRTIGNDSSDEDNTLHMTQPQIQSPSPTHFYNPNMFGSNEEGEADEDVSVWGSRTRAGSRIEEGPGEEVGSRRGVAPEPPRDTLQDDPCVATRGQLPNNSPPHTPEPTHPQHLHTPTPTPERPTLNINPNPFNIEQMFQQLLSHSAQHKEDITALHTNMTTLNNKMDRNSVQNKEDMITLNNKMDTNMTILKEELTHKIDTSNVDLKSQMNQLKEELTRTFQGQLEIVKEKVEKQTPETSPTKHTFMHNPPLSAPIIHEPPPQTTNSSHNDTSSMINTESNSNHISPQIIDINNNHPKEIKTNKDPPTQETTLNHHNPASNHLKSPDTPITNPTLISTPNPKTPYQRSPYNIHQHYYHAIPIKPYLHMTNIFKPRFDHNEPPVKPIPHVNKKLKSNQTAVPPSAKDKNKHKVNNLTTPNYPWSEDTQSTISPPYHKYTNKVQLISLTRNKVMRTTRKKQTRKDQIRTRKTTTNGIKPKQTDDDQLSIRYKKAYVKPGKPNPQFAIQVH